MVAIVQTQPRGTSGASRVLIKSPKIWFLGIAIALVALFPVMRGYHLDKTRPSERYIYHVMPVALSVLYYHWPYDYTGSFAVESAIIAQHDNLPPILDDVARHPEKYDQDKRVYFWRADDRGTLDFTVAAFYLFGPKIASMAYFYLAVLAASVVLFALMHRRNSVALKSLTFSLMGLAVCFGVWNFVNRTGGSAGFEEGFINLSESRFFGLLAFFPVLALFFVLTQRTPMTLWQGAGAVIQSLLFVEIIHARMSVLSLVPPLLLMAGAGIFSHKIAPSRRNAVAVLALVILGLVTKSAYQHAAYNEVYFTDKGGRTIWHNVVIGLSWNPFFVKKLGIEPTDQASACVVLRYEKSGVVTVSQQQLTGAQLKEVADGVDAAMNAFGDQGTYDWPAHELKARRYVFAVFAAYPAEFLKTFLWNKPLYAIKLIAEMFLPHRQDDPASGALPLIYPAALAALVAAIAGYFAFGNATDASVSSSFHAFFWLCVIFSMAISIAFYPAPTQLGDVTLILLVWGFGFVYDIAYRLRDARQRRFDLQLAPRATCRASVTSPNSGIATRDC
jgi:hypothetical protein